MQYCEILFGTPEYDQSVALRYDVLRSPLGLSFEPEVLELEFSDHHLAAMDKAGNVVGILIMTPKANKLVKMRQFAVNDAFQRKGIGRSLVKYAEEWSRHNGFEKIELNARKIAVPFYLNLDYTIEGKEFTEVTIPHLFMWKQL